MEIRVDRVKSNSPQGSPEPPDPSDDNRTDEENEYQNDQITDDEYELNKKMLKMLESTNETNEDNAGSPNSTQHLKDSPKKSSDETTTNIAKEVKKIESTESQSGEPDKNDHIAHFIWTITKSDTFTLIYKMFTILTLGLIFYIIGTINVWFFFCLGVILPIILFIINQWIYKELFVDSFETYTPLIRVKYITFIVQNFCIVLVYWVGTDNAMSHLMTWILRINILEVLVDTVIEKRYVLWIPTLMLMFPICSDPASNTFPILKMRLDDNFMCVWEGYDPWYIVFYTGWFITWILQKSEKITYSMHCLFPLFAPPQLWFSVRTFSGMFLLWFLYLKKTVFIVETPESINERRAFGEIFDALYTIIFISCYAMSGLFKEWIDHDGFY